MASSLAREVRGESALVPHRGRKPALVQERLQGLEDLDADPQALGVGRGSGRHDHELLQVERVLRVGAAVDDVHHRHRQDVRLGAADPRVERLARVRRGRLGRGQRAAEDRVRAEPPLVRRAVRLDERVVDGSLVGGVHP